LYKVHNDTITGGYSCIFKLFTSNCNQFSPENALKAEKEFAEAFIKSNLPNGNNLLSHFAASHKKFLNSLSLDDIERLATAYLQFEVNNLKIQE